MKRFHSTKRSSIDLLALFSFGMASFAANVHAEEDRLTLDDHRRAVLATRVGRVLDFRARALATCRPNARETEALEVFRRRREEYTARPVFSFDGLVARLEAYSSTVKIKASKSECGRMIARADLALFESEREKFRDFRLAARIVSPTPYAIPPSEWIFMELDPWCAGGVRPNFGGKRDANPCFAGERPILGSIRDAGNRKGATYFDAAMETDHFLVELGRASDVGATELNLTALFPVDDHHRILGILAYLYAGGTSDLGWVDGFGEAFWRSTLDQGASARTALAHYFSWLNRKDRFVTLRSRLRARRATLQAFGVRVEGWNHHEFISAFLACDYRSRGQPLLARAVPEALGIAYESRDFISHLRDRVGLQASAENFFADVARHEIGARFGRRACRPR